MREVRVQRVSDKLVERKAVANDDVLPCETVENSDSASIPAAFAMLLAGDSSNDSKKVSSGSSHRRVICSEKHGSN